MRGTLWRRVLNIGTAVAIAGAGIGAQPALAAAPTHGTLYGLTSDVNAIDPASGALTPLASLASVGPNQIQLALAADEETSTLIALVLTTCCPGGRGFPGGPFTFRLASVDVAGGSVKSSPDLLRPISHSIAIDPDTHSVWGVVNCFDPTVTCATQQVVLIDPVTGIETDMATLPLRANYNALLALAPRSDTLYIAVGAGAVFELFAMNTVTHAVTTLSTLSPDVRALAVDPKNGDLYAIEGDSAPLSFTQTLVRIDPSTGSSTLIATCNCLGFHSPTITAKSHTLFALAQVLVQNRSENEIATVDLRTGAMVFGGPINALFVGPLAFLPARA